MEAIESVYMHNLNQPTLDKHYLGFHPQPPNTTSFSLEPNFQNPEENDVDDEIALQIIVLEVQNLVLNQAFSEEKRDIHEGNKAKFENEDEMAVKIINELVQNLVLNKAFSEEKRDIHEGSERDECINAKSENEDVIAVKIINEELQNLVLNQVFSEERYIHEGKSIKAKSENEDEIAVQIINEELQNLVLNRAYSEERDIHEGKSIKEKSENEDEIAVKIINEEVQSLVLNPAFSEERVKGGVYEGNGRGEIGNELVKEMYGNEWGDCHYDEEGEHSWSENGNVIDVEKEKGGEVGFKEWGFNGNGRKVNYPLRPDAVDCAYYMKTGTCQYGSSCKFNHPSRRQNQWSMEKGKQKEESEERAWKIECKYYQTEGGCKYGNACKFSHSRTKGASSPVLDFNFLGLPIRPGEKDCPYYMRTGSCKYGSNCRFHHPDPTKMAGSNPSSGYNNGGFAPVQSASYPTVSSWSSPRSSIETAPFVPVIYPASQGIPPLSPQWNTFQAPVYPTSEKRPLTPPAFTMKDPASKTNFYPRPQQPWLVEEYPERPGQPDCSYFIKTGDCKYKSNCKFHHPKTQKSKTNPSVLSDKGLPLRPGQAVCSFYTRYGICKYGPGCKFDHPEHNGNSASSPGFAFYQPPFRNSATTDGLRMARKGNGSGSLVQ